MLEEKSFIGQVSPRDSLQCERSDASSHAFPPTQQVRHPLTNSNYSNRLTGWLAGRLDGTGLDRAGLDGKLTTPSHVTVRSLRKYSAAVLVRD